MGEKLKLYCFITGKGDDKDWSNELRNINEQEAWEKAFQKKIETNDKWKEIYNNWNSGKWGQINSKVGLNGCIIWIKKKEKFKPTINNKVENAHAKKIVDEIERKLKEERIQNIDEIIILVHAYDGIDQKVTTTYKAINQIPVKWIGYTTARGIKEDEPIWMVKLVIEAIYSCNKLSNLCNELYKALREAEKKTEATERIKNFSLLKHRIAHLFLPLDIDLQGIGEVEGKKVKIKENNKEIEKDAQVAYLEEVLKAKNKNYKQKLADLWYSVTGRDFDGKVNDWEIPKAQDDWKKLVNENKAIIDLIKESGKQNKVKDLWEILLNLCGIRYNSQKPFENKFSVINSPILGFMCLMDKKIGKDMIEKGDVEEILNYFSKLNDKKGWEVKGANPEKIKSFHDWFCALNDCMDRLREELKEERSK